MVKRKDTVCFHFTIVDITYCNLTRFLYYKDIIRKAFFTMATLSMLLLENELFIIIAVIKVGQVLLHGPNEITLDPM